MSVEKRVLKAVNGVLFAQKSIKPESSFVVDLGSDSLDHVEIIMAVEDEFNIEVSDEDGDKWEKVQDVIDYVALRVPQ